MLPRDDGESWTEEIRLLEAEIERFKALKSECEKQIRQLLLEEAPGQGKFFAGEIYRLQQEKLRLEVEMDLRRKKRNRILLALGDRDPFSA